MYKTSAYKSGLFLFVIVACLLIWSAHSGRLVAQSATGLAVRLVVASFDPLAESPVSFLTTRWQREPYGLREKGYYIVQFNGPITARQKLELARMGVELFDYIPDFSFIARMEGQAAVNITRLPFIRWVGINHPGYRLAWPLPPTFAEDSPTLELYALIFPGENTQAIAEQLAAMGADIVQIVPNEWRDKIVLRADADLLPDMLQIDGISWMETAPQWELYNDQARVNAAMDINDVWTRGYFGDGQIIAIADTQLDTGNPATMVNDFRQCAGTAPRVTIVQLGTASSDTNGHGTHVAGSVLGNGRLDGSSCGNYTPFGAGAAPQATGYFQAVMNADQSLGGIPANLNDLFQPAYNFGARLHTNSWGSSQFGQYTTSAQEADQFSWNNKDFLIHFSAGNSGRDSDANGVIDVHSLGSPAIAKNVLTVGASENNRPGIQIWNVWYTPALPILNSDLADNFNGLAAFSSRGPTDDGRTKPDLVAPGTLVRSVRSTASPGSGNYVLFSGTSMSTPLTAGASALARQVFQASEIHVPTSAMLKSLLVNGATDIYPGQYGGGATQEIPTTRPTMHAGWGRVDLEDALFPVNGRTWWWDHNDLVITSSLNSLSTNDTVTYTFALNSTAPLHITMAWTDYPGTPAAAGGLVNDLDMRLEGPGGPYYANNAVQRLSSQLLDYNNGAFTTLETPANNTRRAMRFTPTQYPAIPATAKLWFYRQAGGAGSVNFNLVVYGHNGGGAPGATLCTLPRRASWAGTTGFYPVTIDLAPCGLAPLASGDFYISIEYTSAPTGGGQLLLDNVPSGRAWFHNGAGWVNNVMYDYGITAVTYRPVTPSTPYDRVNNLVGIDLPSPVMGTYNLVVTGYNVPQPPQPYGLTISGDFQMMGTETVTRTIPAPGIYKFGNTGVTINFTSEDVDTVAVTVRRDQFPTTGMNSVKRGYNITASGGSGAFTADVAFGYEQAEFAASGISSETALQAFRYSGGVWQPMGGTVDAANNTVTVNGVTAFSPWALGEFAPTAVTLQNFSVQNSTWVGMVLTAVLLLAALTLWATWGIRRPRER
ncbi:MAG: S8 family serine peptidase [Ardenticatenaceae bacterium]|nr:S8 family serine peptidase [Ardenticatenaceae bacterium]